MIDLIIGVQGHADELNSVLLKLGYTKSKVFILIRQVKSF